MLIKVFAEIKRELKHHIPFTAFGAVTGIIIMIIFQKLPSRASFHIFYVLHPIHVVLSALVTTSLYEFHKCPVDARRCSIGTLLFIGCVGSIGIATLSDSIIPYIAEILLNMPNRGIHLGFIEKWWLINPLALIGVAFAYFKPTTKFPHAGHVLFSTWASLFHIILAMGGSLKWFQYATVFLFLFIAVWIPCCVSDIVFPLLFVNSNQDKNEKK
ncbi:hypothetical protein JXI42_04955 [bacterium]|nr:hypothetical protein [bacterium]